MRDHENFQCHTKINEKLKALERIGAEIFLKRCNGRKCVIMYFFFCTAVCSSCLKKHTKKYEENQGWIELEDEEKDKTTAACFNDQSR